MPQKVPQICQGQTNRGDLAHAQQVGDQAASAELHALIPIPSETRRWEQRGQRCTSAAQIRGTFAPEPADESLRENLKNGFIYLKSRVCF